MTDSPLPSPGWYDDPAGSGLLRWWNGNGWTEHLRSASPEVEEARAVKPVANLPATPTHRAVENATDFGFSVDGGLASRTYQPMNGFSTTIDATMASMGSGYTVAIWLLAVYPIFSLVGVLILDAVGADALPNAVLNIVVVVFTFALAYADGQTLKARGLPAPSAFWLLLTVLAYFIARRIVLKRVGVTANAPGNVLAGYFLLIILIVAVALATALSGPPSMEPIQRENAEVWNTPASQGF